MTRPTLTPPTDKWASLPAHDYDSEHDDARCVFCGQQRETDTYAEYVEQWFASEWEGPQYADDGGLIEYGPYPESEWAYLRDTCLSTTDLEGEPA